MDFNLFELASRVSQRLQEANEDKSACDSSDKLSKESHSFSILNKAEKALEHGDRDEAAHQYKREMFFSQKAMEPQNRFASAASAGIRAIKEGLPSEEVSWRVDSTLLNLEGNSNYYDSREIPLNPGEKAVSSFRHREIVESYCDYQLNKVIPQDLDNGFKESSLRNLRQCIYLADKYIPDLLHKDNYEAAARDGLLMLEDGALAPKVKWAIESHLE